jgi:hypothetical protein
VRPANGDYQLTQAKLGDNDAEGDRGFLDVYTRHCNQWSRTLSAYWYARDELRAHRGGHADQSRCDPNKS